MCLLFDVMYKCMMWESYPCTCLDIPLGLQEAEVSRVSIQYANESGKVVSPTHRTHLPPPLRRYPWYSFLFTDWADPSVIVRPEGISQWNIPTNLSGMEPRDLSTTAYSLPPTHKYVSISGLLIEAETT